AQGDWQSWSSTQYDPQHRMISQRVYDLIGASGEGAAGTNYGQSDFGYDALERRNRVESPGGTIMRTAWTAPQRVASVWGGADATGATGASPAGAGSPNKIVEVSGNQCGGGTGGGAGSLTQVTAYASGTDTRATGYGYDWRERRTSTDGEVDFY